MNGLDSFSEFQLFQSAFQTIGDRSEGTNYNWHHRHLHVPHFSLFSGKVTPFAFLDFHSVVRWDGDVLKTLSFFFFVGGIIIIVVGIFTQLKFGGFPDDRVLVC